MKPSEIFGDIDPSMFYKLELYDKAKALKEKHGGLSIVLLQFKLHITYEMAKELMYAVDSVHKDKSLRT